MITFDKYLCTCLLPKELVKQVGRSLNKANDIKYGLLHFVHCNTHDVSVQ